MLGGRRENESIGARLRRLRLERGLSQRQLSSPGVSYAYISRIEAGTRTPSVKALRMLAKKLGVSVEYLETGRDLPESEERELRLLDAELELRLSDDPAEAERKLAAVLGEAIRAGDAVVAVRARIALGIAAAQRGSHLEAVERLEAVVNGEAPPEPHGRSDLYTTLGRSYAALGEPDRAAHLFERCLQEVTGDRPADTAVQIRYATLLSYALSDAGDYEGAASVVADALARADGRTDPLTRVRLYWSLARLNALEDRSAEALDYIRRAIALLKVTDDTLMLARANLLAAGIELRRGAPADAQPYLGSAERFLGATPDRVDLGMLRIGQSWLAGLEGNAPLAVKRARDALVLLGDFHGGEQGAAFHTLARGLALQDDEAGANDAYRHAVDLLAVHGRRHDAAQAAVEWAKFLQERGHEDEAAAIPQHAADLGLEIELKANQKR